MIDRTHETLSIAKRKDDGRLIVPSRHDERDNYDYITVDEFINAVEEEYVNFAENEHNNWNAIDEDVYEKAFDDVGLKFSNYDDPDMMWQDFLNVIYINFKHVGTWWNSQDIELVDIHNEGIFALSGWNGESYTESWKVDNNDMTVALDGAYDVMPATYRINNDGNLELTAYVVREL